MQMFKVLLTASFPMTCKGSYFSFVHTMWELLPPHYVTNTDVPVVAVLPLSDSRINNTSYQLRRVHSSAHGRRVCTVLSFSQISQTHSLVIRFQLCCSFSFSLTWLSLYLKSFPNFQVLKTIVICLWLLQYFALLLIDLLSQRSYKSLFYCN